MMGEISKSRAIHAYSKSVGYGTALVWFISWGIVPTRITRLFGRLTRVKELKKSKNINFELPNEVITERLVISNISTDDLTQLFELPRSCRDAWNLLGELVRGNSFYSVRLHGDQKVIGLVGLSVVQLDRYENEFELGYRIHPNFEGAGYTTEAAKSILRFSLETDGVKRIISVIEPSNVKSIRVAKRLGLQWDGSSQIGKIPVDVYSTK